VGADVEVVAQGMGLDRRIGPKFLHAGPGFGGSCFPKDAAALVQFASALGDRLRIAEAALDVNAAQRERMVRKTSNAIGGLRGRRIALLGLSFKPDTDDVRESAGLDLAGRFLEAGATVIAHDPAAMETARATEVGKRLEYAEDAYAAAEGADVAVVATDWELYRRLDLRRFARGMRRPVLMDLRDIYDPQEAAGSGLDYHCVGRPSRLGGTRTEMRTDLRWAREGMAPGAPQFATG
jgi:UDPglucose 6-dehydrogenase